MGACIANGVVESIRRSIRQTVNVHRAKHEVTCDTFPTARAFAKEIRLREFEGNGYSAKQIVLGNLRWVYCVAES
jgi:hypothetical protein